MKIKGEINQVQNSFIKKDITNLLKGIAIILMITHHFFTFPNWYIEVISYPSLISFSTYFCVPTKICVSIFAFLTGWSYAFNKNQNIKYSINKIVKFLINYWIIYFILLLITIALNIPAHIIPFLIPL